MKQEADKKLDIGMAETEARPDKPGQSEIVVDFLVVKSLKRKADWILLPLLAVAYLFNSLARSNIANAHTAGLEEDLHLQGNEFNLVLTWYQIPFTLLGPLVTMITKQLGANITIPAMLVGFGVPSLATGFVKSYGQLVACRVIVGIFESGFLASVIFYLSTWYTKKELASRIGIFYAALVASSAFGGLLSYGMFQVHKGKFFTWSNLFFLEGSLTLTWAIVTFVTLPKGTQTAWFLTEEQKRAAALRLEQDDNSESQSKFNLKQAFSEFMGPHGWIRVVIAFIAGTILTSNANFLAIIVKRLGFSVVKTNLFTVAPALTGAVVLVVWCKLSDHFRERGFHMAGSAVLSLVGYIILATISTSNTAVLYFAMFLCTMGAYPSTPIGSTWTVTNIPNLNARAMTSGIYISAANCGGLLSSNIYYSWEAPRYQSLLWTNIAMSSLLIILPALYSTWMRWENKRRDSKQGVEGGEPVTEGTTGNKDPGFRFQP